MVRFAQGLGEYQYDETTGPYSASWKYTTLCGTKIMALERALEILLAELRTKIANLRVVKKKVKVDLEKEREKRASTDKCIPPVRREE